jgi:hypothetical protein
LTPLLAPATLVHMPHPWVTPEQLAALSTLCAELERVALPWMAVGGLAGNLWGSDWPLHDLDFDVASGALARLTERFRPHVVWQGRYVDEEFDLDLLRLNIAGVEVDLSSVDDAFCFTPAGVRTVLRNTLDRRVMRRLGELSVPCQRLEDLLAYKIIIGREHDVRNLEQLRQ